MWSACTINIENQDVKFLHYAAGIFFTLTFESLRIARGLICDRLLKLMAFLSLCHSGWI